MAAVESPAGRGDQSDLLNLMRRVGANRPSSLSGGFARPWFSALHL